MNWRYTLAVGVLVVTASVAQGQSISALSKQQALVEKQQADLQKKIQQLQKRISDQESDKNDVLDDLRQSESQISAISRKLDKLLDQEAAAKSDLQDLKQEESIQKELLDARVADLAELMVSQYTNGISPWTALLSGQDAQKIGRDLAYIRYISRAQSRTVTEVNAEIARLQKVKQRIASRHEQLSRLSAEALSSKKDLESEQAKYRVSLKKIESELAKRRGQAGRLRADDARLSKIIDGIEGNIKAQREALRQAELQRQQAAAEWHRALALQRLQQADLARAQTRAAAEAQQRAQQSRERARQAQQQYAQKQEQAQQQLSMAQQSFGLAISSQDQEQAKRKLQEALQSVAVAQQDVSQARQAAEDAEIERAKARLAQEKAREAQRLLSKAREDEQRAQREPSSAETGLTKGAPWPLRGELMGRFGATRPDTGDVWRGILISASQGAAIKAVATGQVVFANWVRGFGNLIIVDHGNNYLTVYGYNQSLTRSVGESVRAGDTIARAGSSGGQVEPALYFEVRRGTKPENPLSWLAQ